MPVQLRAMGSSQDALQNQWMSLYAAIGGGVGPGGRRVASGGECASVRSPQRDGQTCRALFTAESGNSENPLITASVHHQMQHRDTQHQPAAIFAPFSACRTSTKSRCAIAYKLHFALFSAQHDAMHKVRPPSLQWHRCKA